MTRLNYMIIDIIIFAALAAFFVWKLRSVLGQKTGDERPPVNPFAQQPAAAPANDTGSVIESTAREVPHPAGSLTAAIAAIKYADVSFDEKRFLVGSRTAFSMIVEAFAKGDVGTLGTLLRPAVLSGFVNEIERRKTAGEAVETRIQRILAADISAARIDGTTAVITVDFTSEQLSVTRNAANEVIDGNPNKAELVSESWVFERDITNKDPNWFLVATKTR